MDRMQWRQRIVINNGIHHGEACIKGTRIPVTVILGSLADGITQDDIRQQYPQLSFEDIHAAMGYAAEALQTTMMTPVG